MSYPGDPQQGGRPPFEQTPIGQPQDHYQQNQYYYGQNQWPEQSQATTVLVLGILGFAVCQLLSPFAWVMGNTEIAAIDAGRRPADQRTIANVGRILGIIGTVIVLLMILGVVVMIVVAAVDAGASSSLDLES